MSLEQRSARQGGDSCLLFSMIPPELMDHIMSQLDSITTLGNVIQTCSYIWSRFQARRDVLLFQVLRNQLGPVLVDAQFLLKLTSQTSQELLCQYQADEAVYQQEIYRLAAVYVSMLKGHPIEQDQMSEHQATLNLSHNQLLQLCRTLGEMQCLVSLYTAALSQLFSLPSQVAFPPSQTERLRLLRALYRREILCIILRPRKYETYWTSKDVGTISNTSDSKGNPLGLCATFEPWHLQHIDHVDCFISRLCVELSQLMKRAEHPIPKKEKIKMFASTHHLVQFLKDKPERMNGIIDNPSFLLLPQEKQRCFFGGADSGYPPGTYRLSCLKLSWQACRLRKFPDLNRDRFEQILDEKEVGRTVRFVGEGVDLPPYGWVDAFDGQYANWFGEAIFESVPFTRMAEGMFYSERCLLLYNWRGLGMALWDQKRVEAMKNVPELEAFHTGWIQTGFVSD